MIVTVAATAGCFVPAVGWAACAALQAAAFAVRTEQRIDDQGGWEANKRTIIVDGPLTAATAGLGGAFRMAQFGKLGGVPKAWLPGGMANVTKAPGFLKNTPGLGNVIAKVAAVGQRAKDAEVPAYAAAGFFPLAVKTLGTTLPLQGIKHQVLSRDGAANMMTPGL